MVDRKRTLLGAAGFAATVLGFLAVTQPAFVAETEPLASMVAEASGVEVRTLLLSASFAVGLYLLRAAWRSSGGRPMSRDTTAAERFERLLAQPPESVTAGRRRLTASDVDASIGRATAGDDRALERVRDRLSELAVSTLASRGDASRKAAERAVASGSWTGDRVAAAFLSGPGGVVPSLLSRIRLWLDPETELDRRIRRTIRAIEYLDEAAESGGIAGSSGSATASDRDRPANRPGSEGDRAGAGGGRTGSGGSRTGSGAGPRRGGDVR